MAFTFTEQLNICKILKVELPTLEYALRFNAEYITADTETAVRSELTRWTTAGNKFVEIDPMVTNKGVRIRSNNEKQDIRDNIAILLLMTETVKGGSSSVQVTVERG